MQFNSLAFLVFLPLTLLLFYQVPQRLKVWVLLVAGLVFYGWWKPVYLLVLLAITLTSFYGAQVIHRSQKRSVANLALGVALAVNFGSLFTFKYFDFFSDIFTGLVNAAGGDLDPFHLSLLLPIGISFHTFQCVGYVIDVWRDRRAYEPSLRDYVVYASYFPQLLAGPIERAARLLPQLKKPKTVTYDVALSGLLLIAWGLFMKMVIADRAAPYVETVFHNPQAYSGGHFLLGTFLCAYQLFCDFGGYSLVAMGVSRLFGIELMANFRRPYFAHSLRDFWARWHISLYTWLRDYVYFPLIGLRGGRFAQYRNLLLIFVLSGLWHGAAFTFIVWGLLNGLGILAERAVVDTLNARKLKVRPRFALPARVLQHLYVILFICIGRIVFHSNDMPDAFYMLNNLFTGIRADLNYWGTVILPVAGDNRSIASLAILMACIVVLESVHLVQERRSAAILAWAGKRSSQWIMITALAMAILLLGQFEAASFVYFRF